MPVTNHHADICYPPLFITEAAKGFARLHLQLHKQSAPLPLKLPDFFLDLPLRHPKIRGQTAQAVKLCRSPVNKLPVRPYLIVSERSAALHTDRHYRFTTFAR